MVLICGTVSPTIGNDHARAELGRRRTVLVVVHGYGQKRHATRVPLREWARELFPAKFVDLTRHGRAQDRSGSIGMGRTQTSDVPDSIGRNPITPRQYGAVLVGSQGVNVWVQLFVGIWGEGIRRHRTIVECTKARLDYAPFQFGRVSSEMILRKTFCQPRL